MPRAAAMGVRARLRLAEALFRLASFRLSPPSKHMIKKTFPKWHCNNLAEIVG